MKIGSINKLTVVREANHGLYLSDGESDVLLPRKYVPVGTEIDDEIDVFVTTDSEDRPIATTQKPFGMVGDIVPLEAKQVARAGAFMDWGLEKDLLVPFSEQHHRMQAGQTYVVLILVDQSSGRVYGSTRLAKHLDEDPIILSIGEEVKIMVASVSQDAIRVVVNGRFFATIFADEIFDRFAVGEVKKAFVKQIREDGRIAISLSPQGQKGVVSQGPSIIAMLEKSGGYLPYGDKTSPGEIRSVFGISKGTFKKAIGGLMRAGAIDIEDDGIRIRKSKEGSSRRPR